MTIAPELPATELVEGCYYEMFRGCYALEETPEFTCKSNTFLCLLLFICSTPIKEIYKQC